MKLFTEKFSHFFIILLGIFCTLIFISVFFHNHSPGENTDNCPFCYFIRTLQSVITTNCIISKIYFSFYFLLLPLNLILPKLTLPNFFIRAPPELSL